MNQHNARITFSSTSLAVDLGNGINFPSIDHSAVNLVKRIEPLGYAVATARGNQVTFDAIADHPATTAIALYKNMMDLGFTPRIQGSIQAPKSGSAAWTTHLVGPEASYSLASVDKVAFSPDGYERPSVEVYFRSKAQPLVVAIEDLLVQPDSVMSLEFHYPGKLDQILKKIHA